MRGRARRSAIGQGPIYTDGMRRLRVLCLMHDYLVPPDDDTKYDTSVAWKTEFDVKNTLEVAGHDVRTVGVGDDLGVVRTAI